MSTWISDTNRESSIIHAAWLAGNPITILYLTVDLAEADHLVYEVHKVAPNLRLDVSLRVLHAIDRLRPGRHHAVLVDHRVSRRDRSRLIAHIHQEKLPLPIILMFDAAEEDATIQTLKAGADERIVKGPSFARDLPAVIEKALARYESDAAGKSPAPLHWEDPIPKAPESVETQTAAKREPAAADTVVTSHRRLAGGGKRALPRYEVYIPCRVLWQEHSFDGCIHDLSDEGAFVETPAPTPAGSQIGILLTTATEELQLEATVSHYGWYMTAVRNFDGIGIHFENLSAPAAEVLKELRGRSAAPAPPKTTLER